jgi:multisubunit Na+/H+ antiporter MnhG subunit
MFRSRPIVIGFFMVLAGAVLPFLMVIGILESTFFMNFIAFASSTIGVFLGVIGVAMYVGENRKKDEDLFRD